MSEPYDSRPDTRAHITRVRQLMANIWGNIYDRADRHDASKLEDPERSMFDRYTPQLRALTYGSPEYKACLEAMGEALRHHYAHNSHHPEHYPDGIAGMSLLDVIEMLADWKAAGERHADGDLLASLEINRERFGISDQLHSILVNTVRELGWERR